MRLVETPTYNPECEKFDSFLGCCSETLMICREKLCPKNKELNIEYLDEIIQDTKAKLEKEGFKDIKFVELKDNTIIFSLKAPETAGVITHDIDFLNKEE